MWSGVGFPTHPACWRMTVVYIHTYVSMCLVGRPGAKADFRRWGGAPRKYNWNSVGVAAKAHMLGSQVGCSAGVHIYTCFMIQIRFVGLGSKRTRGPEIDAASRPGSRLQKYLRSDDARAS